MRTLDNMRSIVQAKTPWLQEPNTEPLQNEAGYIDIYRKKERQKERKTDGPTDRPTERIDRTDRPIDRRMDGRTETDR